MVKGIPLSHTHTHYTHTHTYETVSRSGTVSFLAIITHNNIHLIPPRPLIYSYHEGMDYSPHPVASMPRERKAWREKMGSIVEGHVVYGAEEMGAAVRVYCQGKS